MKSVPTFKSRIKAIARDVALALALTLVMLAATAERVGATGIPAIPSVGKTSDGQYVRYALDGDLDDFQYFTPTTKYEPTDLFKVLPFVAPKDVRGNIYTCTFICKDRDGYTIGINPAYADRNPQ